MPGKIRRRRTGWIVFSLLALFILTGPLVAAGCAASTGRAEPAGRAEPVDFDSAYRRAVRPYAFNYAEWELQTFGTRLGEKIAGAAVSEAGWDTEDALLDVIDYFETAARLEAAESRSARAQAQGDDALALELADSRAALLRELEAARPRVESILSRQIALTLAENGVFNPFLNGALPLTFPPLSFQLEPSLNLLVISSRSEIARLRDTVIQPEISLVETGELENSLEQYPDISALVVPLGGLGATYPSFVIQSSSLEYTLKVVAEEWLHQYLLFRPLGFQYVLELTGLRSGPDIATLNETVVGLAADEIGAAVFNRYYAAFYPPVAPAATGTTTFDFNAALRAIRRQTDTLLAAGQVTEAEEYMEEERLKLAEHGYYIRRLNQAYFAFHGSYAFQDSSIDPLGDQVRQLREISPTLQDYLRTASVLTSRRALTEYLESTTGDH